MEALVLRCPGEVTPFLGAIIQAGIQFIKYDPVCISNVYARLMLTRMQNYAGDDEDEEMEDAEADDQDAEADE